MPDRMKFSNDVTVGAQPSEAEFEALAEGGVKTVINVRHDGEDLQPLSVEAEGAVVREAGMDYVNVPVSMKDADFELVDRFRAALDEAAKPAFVHCKLGSRAGAMVMMDHAAKQGWTGAQTLAKAEEMGFECKHEKLAALVRGYVDAQRG